MSDEYVIYYTQPGIATVVRVPYGESYVFALGYDWDPNASPSVTWDTVLATIIDGVCSLLPKTNSIHIFSIFILYVLIVCLCEIEPYWSPLKNYDVLTGNCIFMYFIIFFLFFSVLFIVKMCFSFFQRICDCHELELPIFQYNGLNLMATFVDGGLRGDVERVPIGCYPIQLDEPIFTELNYTIICEKYKSELNIFGINVNCSITAVKE